MKDHGGGVSSEATQDPPPGDISAECIFQGIVCHGRIQRSLHDFDPTFIDLNPVFWSLSSSSTTTHRLMGATSHVEILL